MLSVKLIKKDGILTYLNEKSRLDYQIFLDKIPEGQKLEMYIGLADADHSIAQLAKVHACIRELAKESGYSFEEMKILIKEKSGLCYNAGDVIMCKSFADCDKTEIALAIEACIQIGRENYNLNLA
jgi:TusA-related sulfurtransferase